MPHVIVEAAHCLPPTGALECCHWPHHPLPLPLPSHSLCAGVEAAAGSSSYLLCLDDDVALHSGAVGMLVHSMEADETLFMATGYPFDVLPEGARWD